MCGKRSCEQRNAVAVQSAAVYRMYELLRLLLAGQGQSCIRYSFGAVVYEAGWLVGC